MRYYSTSHRSPEVTLAEAIMHSEAPDGGLYMPGRIPRLPKAVFNNISEMSETEIAYLVADSFFGEDLPSSEIKKIGEQTLNFPVPLVEIEPGIWALELFHGPTMNAKDVACRFTARMLASINREKKGPLHVLVSTNGNSGCAVANGFRNIEDVEVFAMYPKGTPAHIVEQLAGPGGNIHPLCVNGTIDDCRTMLWAALSDPKLNQEMLLTCANSVNIARILPSAICYFLAYAKLMAKNPKAGPLYVSVPCGNGGGLLAGYLSQLMGLPIAKIIAACNANGMMARYLSGEDLENAPRESRRTLAYAMDTCCPTNMPRFQELCKGNISSLKDSLAAGICSDEEIRSTISDVCHRTGYILDPHSAVGYKCLKEHLPSGATGIVLATAHPARSAQIVSEITGVAIEPPASQKCFKESRNTIGSRSRTEQMIPPTYPALKKILKQNR